MNQDVHVPAFLLPFFVEVIIFNSSGQNPFVFVV